MQRVVINQPSSPRAEPVRKARWAGVSYPLRDDGMLALVVDEHAVSSSLRILLMTEPGERINEPDFGVGLRGLLFEQDDPGLHEEAARRIGSAIERFDPRIVVVPPGIVVESEEEGRLEHTGAVKLVVSFKWAFSSNLSSVNDFKAILFRRSGG
jgi:phage baseplate assembly protein W